MRHHVAAIDATYVYVLCRPDGRPFYVGKGVGQRLLHHEAEARTTNRKTHKLNLIRAMARKGSRPRYLIDSVHLDETEALARERVLIAAIGRHDLGDGPLTNQTDGGEGTSNPSEESRARRRETLYGDDPDCAQRALANRWFRDLAQVRSVPVKPVRGFRAEGLWANREQFGFTGRQAAALAASAISHGVMLEPGARLPRRMLIEETDLIIENGVGRDILSSGMATLEPGHTEGEAIFRLSVDGYAYILDEVGVSRLIDAGIVDPHEED